MMEVCVPVALYFLLKAVPMTAVSKHQGCLGKGPAQGPAGQHPKHTDPSLFKQTVWAQHILQVAESQRRLSGLGGLFCFSRFCFVLFNLCAICMDDYCPFLRSQGLEVPSLYLTQIFSWVIPTTSCFQLSLLANGSVPNKSLSDKESPFLLL